MKIAFVYDVVYPYVKGGVEKRIYELSLCMVKRGHEVHIFGMKYWSGSDIIEKDGIFYHGVCKQKNLYVNGRRSIFQAIYFSLSLFLPLLRERPSVVDCQSFPYFPCISSWLASKIMGSSLIITWHEIWGDYWYEYLGALGVFGKIIERLISGFGDKRIAVSEHTKRLLLKISGQKEISVIPNAIDTVLISSVEPSYDVSHIIAVGRLVEEKNFELLVKSVAIIKKEIPDLKVMIVGDGPCKKFILNLSKECGVGENINFFEFMDSYEKMISLMKASKIFASPSLREGFGLSALEAMACGLPIVTVEGDMNAVCEMVKESGCGAISKNDPYSYSKAILGLFDNPDNMEVFGKAYSEKYSIEKISSLYACIISED